jgi:dTDP-3-amino-3,4,6-trideoxy-alpha-D-glucose transaminase
MLVHDPELQARVLKRWAEVVESGVFVLGENLAGFEEEFASYLGVRHCVGVGSGTDALLLSLQAMGVGPGDEVLVPAMTFVATGEAVVNAGATPVFCDVDDRTWVMTPDTAEPRITDRTRAIVPVHLFGNLAPVDELARFGLPILEDACQAAGSAYRGRMAGSLGAMAAFSFYPSKTLGCFGDGGMVATGDAALAERVRLLRHHGSGDNRRHQLVGRTSRLDEIQAAALRVLLDALPDHVRERRRMGEAFTSRYGDRAQRETEGAESSWHQFALTVDEGGDDELPAHRRFGHLAIHLQPSMEPYRGDPLPNAERIASACAAIDAAHVRAAMQS